MSQKVSVGGLADAVNKELETYVQDTADMVKQSVQKAADEAVKELKSTSPKQTGKYAKSWRVKNVKESTNELDAIVHNKKYYRLTHLLENGHAKRNGGRVAGIEHIKPVETKVTKQLLEDIKKGIQHG